MNTVTREEYKKLLLNPVFKDWLASQYMPAMWVNPECLEETLSPISGKLMYHRNTQTYFKKQLGLESLDWSFFELPLVSLLYAPTPVLQRILRSLGALSYSINLKQVIEKDFRQQLLATMSASSFEFLSNVGPLLWKTKPVLLQEINRKVPLWDAEQKILACLETIGELILLKAISFGMSEKSESAESLVGAWMRYLRLRLPRDNPLPESLEASLPPGNAQVVVLIKKLVRHLEPECSVLLN